MDENGYEKLAFVQPDQFDDMIPLFFMDQKLSNCYKTIDRKSALQLEAIIQEKFDNDYKHKSKKEQLHSAIIEIGKAIKAERNAEDAIYSLHKAEASEIIGKLKS